ncbi:hypothetical protein GGX14DRAFT_571085 [Mycena pura]|uniref:Uncharacterized protein n=1 Tax=Mycena pura TaxID=153505 RepID=A0AAD6V7K0_9AGAR|nr:hypothetical protein GGX14DRAFT_571085 [Mycena pura]
MRVVLATAFLHGAGATQASVLCASVDKDGTSQLSQGGIVPGGFGPVTCTYQSPGKCLYFPDGTSVSGSSQCPDGLAQDSTPTTSTATSRPSKQYIPFPALRISVRVGQTISTFFLSSPVATGSSFVLNTDRVSTLESPEPTSFSTTGSTSSPVASASGLSQPGPTHNIKDSAIAGGIVGVVFVIGVAIALFLCRRVQRRHAPGPAMLSTSPLLVHASPLAVTTGGQTVLAIEQPIKHGVVETQEILSKITGRYRRSQTVNRSDREESGNRSGGVVGPAGGAALEMQMRAMAERMALLETRLQMHSLADEQPLGYTAA